jgi:regulator of cell morphogenesis and NO signaling
MSDACGCGCQHGGAPGAGTAASGAIGSGETVEGVVRRSPRAAGILRGLGIDTCCGGALTLVQAAASAGVPVETVLQALGAGRGEA